MNCWDLIIMVLDARKSKTLWVSKRILNHAFTLKKLKMKNTMEQNKKYIPGTNLETDR